MTCKRHGRAALARRARCVGLRSEGDRRVDARSKLGGNDAFVSTWTRAFQAQGLAGLVSWLRAARPARRWPRTSIQALDRDDRTLPLSPGRAQRHDVHDKRNGTLRLFAALDSTTGKVLGKTDKQLVAISVGTTKPIGSGPVSRGSSRTRSEFGARPAAPPFAGEAKADLVASFSRRSQCFTRLQPGSPARTMVNRCFWRVIVCDGVWVLIEFQKKTELPPDRSDGLDRAIVGVTYFRRDGYMIETTGIRHRITLTCDKPFDPNKEGVV